MIEVGRFLETDKRFGVPSLFDIIVVAFILILPHIRIGIMDWRMLKGVVIIYTSILLMCLRVYFSQRREFRSLPLMILAVWGLVHIFWHSFADTGEIAKVWINWCLLNEGYLNIFFGVYFITSVVKYSKSWGWYYIPLLFSFGYTYKYIFCWPTPQDWSMTPMFAVIIATGFTLIKRTKKRWVLIPSAVVGVTLAVFKWSYIIGVKLKSRPDFWKFTIGRIARSKFWMGHGYYHTINTRKGLVAPETEGTSYLFQRWGAGWRQSDLLEFGEYMGIIAMVCVVCFFGWLLWKGRPGLAYFFVLGSVLMCLFQRTLFFPGKGGLVLVAIALLTLETICGKNRSYLT